MKQKLHKLFYCQKSAVHWKNFNTVKLFTLFFFITSSFFSMAAAQGTAVIRTVGTSSFCSTGSSINANIRVDITGGISPYTMVYRATYGGNTADFTVSNYTSGTSIPVSQISTTNYTLVSVTNSTGTTTAISGTAAITIFEPILGTITHATCQNASGSVAISALPLTPWTIRSSGGQILANRVGMTSFTLPLPVGTNNFTITSSGASPCTQSFSVTINPPAAPNAPVLDASQLACSQTSFDQSWTAVENAVGYELDVSSSSDFSTFLPGYESKKLGTVTSEKVTGITAGTTYYVRLRAVGQCALSPNSAATEVSSIMTTIYDNGIWSNGLPDTNKNIVFNSSYTVDANMNGCSCQVIAGAVVNVNTGITLKLENELNVQGSLTFQDKSSLVQVNEAVNVGNITYKRVTTPVRRYDFTYWSSPITKAGGFTLKDLSPNTLGDKYYSYNPSSGSWIIHGNGAVVMAIGKGYSVRAPQTYDINIPSLFTAEFVGVPNNGNISINTNSGKWNLIGNPYPSAVDAEKLFAANTNLGSLSFWTHKNLPSSSVPGDATYNYTAEDYAILNLTGSIKTSPLLDLPTGFIAAGQGFFSKPEASSVNFTNDMRVENQNSQFFKQAKNTTAKNRIWLNFTNTQGAFKQALIGYVEGATNGIDINYDAVTMNGNAFVDFYSFNGITTSKLTIQGRALPFEENDIVPLGYKSTIAGTFTIALDKAEGIFEQVPVYLEDKTTNIFHNLTCANYSFDTAIGTFNDRFIIHYNNIDNKPALVAPIASNSILNCNETSYVQNWTAVKNAKKYKINVATDVNFTNFLAGYQDKELENVISETVTGIVPGTKYYVRLKAINDCGSSLNSTVVTPQVISTTYENGIWTNGFPDNSKDIIFNSDYNLSSDINGCSCQVNTGVSVVVNPGVTVKLENALNIQGTMTFENDASLVQVNDAVNTGNIVYKRKTSINRFDLTYWSSPINRSEGFTLHDLSPNTLFDKYFYYVSGTGWATNLYGTLNMNPGEGYSVRGPQNFDSKIASDFTAEFIGIPNNGNISINAIVNKYVMAGNPYPSAINVKELYRINPTLKALYFWTHDTPIAYDPADGKYKYSSNDFVPLNLTGTVKTFLEQDLPPSEIIGSGQGFITNPGVSFVNFTNSMRVIGQNSHFYKISINAGSENRLWLNLTNIEGAFKQLLLGYLEGATNNEDANFDAITINSNPTIDFYSLNGTSKLTIQGRALPFDETDAVPLGYKSTIAGNFTIAIDKAEGIFENQAVFLEDKLTAAYHDLTSSNYDFTTAIGTFTDRFVIHYINNSAAVTGKKAPNTFVTTSSEIIVFVENNKIGINAADQEIEQIIIYDVNGRIVLQKNNVNDTTYLTDHLDAEKQLIVVKTVLKNGKIISNKVVL